ncbi:PREDICTED: probable ATP-dependent DNA helicase RecS [Priapulus caudatus]|uniref:Probable ATP-dependent DNA helicase RecS n=1 Tax=Priapulus caudatus TaxID=37621 RepID=A0ABM1E6T6_PRICU|nr:PREDICTED: probable ATP-dependent DNA helicase RecS [Priapulus caudatus]
MYFQVEVWAGCTRLQAVAADRGPMAKSRVSMEKQENTRLSDGYLSSYALHPETQHITLVISPLRSLMLDQVSRWSSRGVRCAALLRKQDMKQETVADLHKGVCKIVYSSPEAIMTPIWWEWVRLSKNSITLLCIDEAHCLAKWGGTFREQYLKIVELRCRLASTPVMMLTATATSEMVTAIIGAMHLKEDAVLKVARLPDRPNIHLTVKTLPSKAFDKALGWYVSEIKAKGSLATKALIYARQVDHVASIYHWLMLELGSAAYSSSTRDVHSRVVEMYHSSTDADSHTRIASSVVDAQSAL